MSTPDAVIIGSGFGALTCAAHLARAGMKVRVLEQHLRIGGYAHRFKRGAFEFDSGIHSVPMAPGGIIDGILSGLGVRGRISTIELPEMLTARLPGRSFTVPSRTDEIYEYFMRTFPGQRAELSTLFDNARSFYATVEGSGFDFEEGFIGRNREFVQRYHSRPYADYLDGITHDPALRHLLHAMWPYAGMPPRSAATVFCVMMFAMHWLEGSHYVRGGFSQLAETLADVVRECGGEVCTRSEVCGLETERDRVRAAITADGARHEARLFVSNIAPLTLHTRLLAQKSQSRRWIRRARNLNPSLSVVGVYLGIASSFTTQLPANVMLLYDNDDHEAAFEKARVDPARADHLIMLSPAEASANPTVLLMRFCAQGASRRWREDKLRVAESMLGQAQRAVPGLREAVQVMEVGSPDTFQRYTGNTGGAIYGYENTCALYGEARMPTRTHLPNLYQTGHWQRPGSGVWNTMLNGTVVSRAILRAHG